MNKGVESEIISISNKRNEINVELLRRILMDEVRILVVCGGGASSGFLAQNMRKAAKKKNIKLFVKARSETEVEDFISDIDVLLIGPHLKYMEEELMDMARAHNVPGSVIPDIIYGRLDGEKCLELVNALREGSNQ